MGSDDDIAEERLLRVIEGGSLQGAGASGSKSGTPPKGPLGWFRQIFLTRWTRPVGKGHGHFLPSLSTINFALAVALVFGVVYLVWTARFSKRELAPDLIPVPPAETAAPSEAKVKLTDYVKPEKEYLAPLRKRNPYTGAAEELDLPPPEPKGPTAHEKLQEMMSGLTLVGINRGAVRDAIIEDSVQKRSYFVKAGDRVKEMTVKEITNEAVKFSYEDEETSLS